MLLGSSIGTIVVIAFEQVKAEVSGEATAVIMWWDLQMDEAGDIIISTAPYWIEVSCSEKNL